jgi:hypothetical protein
LTDRPPTTPLFLQTGLFGDGLISFYPVWADPAMLTIGRTTKVLAGIRYRKSNGDMS